MATPPAGAAPPIIPPEPIDAARYGNLAFIIIQAILVLIATVLVVARLYARQFILKSVGLDELFIVIGVVSEVLMG